MPSATRLTPPCPKTRKTRNLSSARRSVSCCSAIVSKGSIVYTLLYSPGNIAQDAAPVNNNLGTKNKKQGSAQKVWSGERIKQVREAAKRSAQDVADKAKIPESTYLTYEKTTEPPFSRLVAIAAVLGRDPYWLADMEKPRSTNGTGAGEERFAESDTKLVNPHGVPATEAMEIIAGYCHFGSRRIEASMCFRPDGPPGELGGLNPSRRGSI